MKRRSGKEKNSSHCRREISQTPEKVLHTKCLSVDSGSLAHSNEIKVKDKPPIETGASTSVFMRGKVEGSSFSRLNRVAEAFKRHSIAALPRDVQKTIRKRDLSHGRIKSLAKDRIVVDINLGENCPSKSKSLENSPSSTNSERKSRDKTKNNNKVFEENDEFDKNGGEKCVEPIYEKLKSKDDTSNTFQYYDNALYMTMKDDSNIEQAHQMTNPYTDVDPVYARPKAAVPISCNSNCPFSPSGENTYENVLYLPMADVSKGTSCINTNQSRPLPTIPTFSRTTSTQTDKRDVTFIKSKCHSTENSPCHSEKMNNRPPLPLPGNSSQASISHRIIRNNDQGKYQDRLVHSVFAMTSQVSRTDIRQSTIRHNSKTELSTDEESGSSERSIPGETKDPNPYSQVYFSDNPDSGVSEGMTTPVLSPCGLKSPISVNNRINSYDCNNILYGNRRCNELYQIEGVFPHDFHREFSYNPRYQNLTDFNKSFSNVTHVSKIKTPVDASFVAQPSVKDISKMLHSTVGRNLFGEFSNISAINTTANICDDTILLPNRRHSICSSADATKTFSSFTNEGNATFWNTTDESRSFDLPYLRKARSLDDVAALNDVPLIAAVEKILHRTNDSSDNTSFNKRTSLGPKEDTEPDQQCNLKKDSFIASKEEDNWGGAYQIRREVLQVGDAKEYLDTGNKSSPSLLSGQSSSVHLFRRASAVDNMTPELPEVLWATRNPSSVSTETPEEVDVSPLAAHNLNSAPSLETNSVACLPACSAKLLHRNIQRQEESSYRLLRLFQDCPLDSIEESEDEIEWLSVEWSMQAALDENSSRDPNVLDLNGSSSSDSSNGVRDSVESSGDEIISSPCILNKISKVSEEKMLAKFRKSFRRKDKDKIDPQVNMFLFVDNPMYLSPEVKKEAKVIPSKNNNWCVNNPTYTSPNVNNQKVRTFVKSKDNIKSQCEQENLKNLCLAQSENNSERLVNRNKSISMQANPCYDSPGLLKNRSQSVSSSKSDCTYLAPWATNLQYRTIMNHAHSVVSNDITDMEKYADHEYCTIAGDEESDSWITQSSGSHHPSSPSSKRILQFKETDDIMPSFPKHTKKIKQIVNESLTPSKLRRPMFSARSFVRSASVSERSLECTNEEDRNRTAPCSIARRANSFRQQVGVNLL